MPVRPRARTHMRQYKGALVLLIALQKGKKEENGKKKGGKKEKAQDDL